MATNEIARSMSIHVCVAFGGVCVATGLIYMCSVFPGPANSSWWSACRIGWKVPETSSGRDRSGSYGN